MLLISLQKLFLFSRYLSFCLDFLVMQKNDLIKKITLISKFMTSQPGEQTNAIHILTNISRSKGSQAIKFGQLIEYYTSRIFLGKAYTKFGEKTILRPLDQN